MAALPIRRLIGLVALVASSPAGSQPLPETIVPGELSAPLSDFATIPASSAERPLARLNLLGHAGDGSGRLFVNDMRGIIHVIENGKIETFLDAQSALQGSLLTNSLQLGVSTFAFHPDYSVPEAAGEGKFYTVTSQTSASGIADYVHPGGDSGRHSVLTEWIVDASDRDRIDPTSAREILRIALTSTDHTMAQVAFNPNAEPGGADYGMLYIAVGDGAGYFAQFGEEINPFRTAQDLTNPFGSILRIDPLGSSSAERPTNGAYGIPADNPFADAVDATLKEIWAYGLRNPHRFSWDTGGSGKMIISDIGQANIEELNIGFPGANFGWSQREGTFAVDHFNENAALPLPADDAIFGYTYPVAQYDHDEGFAIIGGFVYRGSELRSLLGKYFFGDNNGRIFYVDVDDLVEGSQATIHELTLVYEGTEQSLLEIIDEPQRADLRFGIDEQQELYVLTKRDGEVRRLPEPAREILVGAALSTLALLRSRQGRVLATGAWRAPRR